MGFYIIEGSFLHVSLFYFLSHFTHSIRRVRYGCSSFSFTFCFYYSCWLLIAWFNHSCSYFKGCSLVCVCFRPLIGIHLGRSFDLRKDARELRGLHVLRSAAPHRTFTAYQPNPWSRLVVRVLTKCPTFWISTRKDIAFTLDNASVHNEWKFVIPCAWVWWRNYMIIQERHFISWCCFTVMRRYMITSSNQCHCNTLNLFWTECECYCCKLSFLI